MVKIGLGLVLGALVVGCVGETDESADDADQGTPAVEQPAPGQTAPEPQALYLKYGSIDGETTTTPLVTTQLTSTLPCVPLYGPCP